MNFDRFSGIIRQNLVEKTGEEKLTYITENGRKFSNYYSNEEFEIFVKEMQMYYPLAYERYSKGEGGELGRKGSGTPPKMAGVASSSRFCYTALRGGAEVIGVGSDIEFERECGIARVKGTAPQLDAYSKTGSVFVEAKCCEIFTKHEIVLSAQYFDHIFGPGNDFGFNTLAEKTEQKKIGLSPCVFGVHKERTMFDIKQLLCHLLGIVSSSEEPATLVYLFFMPKCDDLVKKSEIDELFAELGDEIKAIFASVPIRNFCVKNKTTLRAVAEYSHTVENLTSENIIVIA